MNGYQKRRKTIEEKIMQRAMLLFQEKGFKRVSIEEIAETAEVSKVTIYKYFTNKTMLIVRCFEEAFRQKAAEMEDLVQSDISFLRKVELLMKQKIGFMKSFSGELLDELRTLEPHFVSELMQIRRNSLMVISTTLMEEGREAGYISSEISNEVFMVFLDVVGMGIINSPAYKAYKSHNSQAFKEILKVSLGCLIDPS